MMSYIGKTIKSIDVVLNEVNVLFTDGSWLNMSHTSACHHEATFINHTPFMGIGSALIKVINSVDELDEDVECPQEQTITLVTTYGSTSFKWKVDLNKCYGVDYELYNQ